MGGAFELPTSACVASAVLGGGEGGMIGVLNRIGMLNPGPEKGEAWWSAC